MTQTVEIPMSSRNVLRLAFAAATALLPTAALAHPGFGPATGFAHGFAHPVSGLDHVLAMVMVGLLAYELGGRALWALPTTFVLVMAAGGAMGMAGMTLPFVETGIALSVAVLGTIVALGVKAPTAVAMGVVGLFALFHGHAHGTEMPESMAGMAYAAGFLLATATLHATGIALGFLVTGAGGRYGKVVVRSAGGIAAVAGVALLAGIL
jgi:urease accessory protein